MRKGHTEVNVSATACTPHEMLVLRRLARELRLTDQILSDDLDTLSIHPMGPAPAWTTMDGNQICFNLDAMPMPTDKLAVAVWLGTNAHELGHVLYSPRKGSVLVHWVREGDSMQFRGMADLHNIVEDQRQERFLLARFAPWRAYLTAALGHHLVTSDANSWLLLAGRTWVPNEVRAQSKLAFAKAYGRPAADKVSRIVGAYQRLTDPGNAQADEAWTLLQELYNLLPTVPPVNNGCMPVDGGEPDTSEPDEGAPSPADEADPDVTGDQDGDEDQQGAGDGDGAGGTDDDGADQQNGPQGAQDGNEGEGAGTGKGSERPAPPGVQRARQIKQAAANELDAADVAKDLAGVMEALGVGRGDDHPEGPEAKGTRCMATDDARRLHHEVAEALLELKDANEPAWIKRVDSGRLNVSRLVNPYTDVEELFDRYNPGELDSNDMEVVLLVDVSSSMAGQLFRLGEAVWAVRHAVDDLEGRCTVITWDDGPYGILSGPYDRPDERMFVPAVGGGTQATGAVAEAFQLLAGSTLKNRLMVILTDGAWSDNHLAEPIIHAMNSEGITTVCALQGYGAGSFGHGCQHSRVIKDPADLARLFRDVAATRMAGMQ